MFLPPAGGLFHHHQIFYPFDETVEYFLSELRIGHLPSPEENGNLDLIPLLEEPLAWRSLN